MKFITCVLVSNNPYTILYNSFCVCKSLLAPIVVCTMKFNNNNNNNCLVQASSTVRVSRLIVTYKNSKYFRG